MQVSIIILPLQYLRNLTYTKGGRPASLSPFPFVLPLQDEAIGRYQNMEQLKLIDFDAVKDIAVGKVGTPSREEYEQGYSDWKRKQSKQD